MPIVSAPGKCFTPPLVLPGKVASYLKRSKDTSEIPSDYLPKSNYLFMKHKDGVGTKIFNEGDQHFCAINHCFEI